jgi:hypothetical protein
VETAEFLVSSKVGFSLILLISPTMVLPLLAFSHDVITSFQDTLLPEPATLQGGGLQKAGGLHLALGYRVCDVVTKKNFRTYQGRD